jgi:hypothetical protein
MRILFSDGQNDSAASLKPEVTVPKDPVSKPMTPTGMWKSPKIDPSTRSGNPGDNGKPPLGNGEGGTALGNLLKYTAGETSRDDTMKGGSMGYQGNGWSSPTIPPQKAKDGGPGSGPQGGGSASASSAPANKQLAKAHQEATKAGFSYSGPNERGHESWSHPSGATLSLSKGGIGRGVGSHVATVQTGPSTSRSEAHPTWPENAVRAAIRKAAPLMSKDDTMQGGSMGNQGNGWNSPRFGGKDGGPGSGPQKGGHQILSPEEFTKGATIRPHQPSSSERRTAAGNKRAAFERSGESANRLRPKPSRDGIGASIVKGATTAVNKANTISKGGPVF